MKLTLILFFSVFTVTGQNIKGTILDTETNSPLENVNVYLKREEKGAVSNEKGEFNLKLQSKVNPTETIRFSIIGYATKNYTFSKLKELNFIVYLSKKIENLNEVTIASKRDLKLKISYKILTQLKKGAYNFGSTLIGHKIYVIGGDESHIEDTAKRALVESLSLGEFLKKLKTNFNWEKYSGNLRMYNIENDTWLTSNAKFNERAYHKISYFNNKLYVLGGKTLSTNRKREYLDDKIEVFDLKTQQIIIDNTNPHQAINFAAFAYQDNIIVMGGSIKLKNNGEKIYSDKSHLYNITSGYWYELPKMTKAKEVNGIIIKSKTYLIGGFNNYPLTEIESYDLITEKWEKEGDLFYGIENPALTYHNDTIYIFNEDKIMTYNIKTRILNEYKIDLNIKNAQIHYYKNNLYIVGGIIEDYYSKTPSSGLYSINLNEFYKTKIIKSKKIN